MNKRINRLIFDIGLVMAIMFGVLGCSAVLTEDNDNDSELDWKKGRKTTEEQQIIPTPEIIPTPAGYGWSKHRYDGHVYIFVLGCTSIVHDPDCPCSKK